MAEGLFSGEFGGFYSIKDWAVAHHRTHGQSVAGFLKSRGFTSQTTAAEFAAGRKAGGRATGERLDAEIEGIIAQLDAIELKCDQIVLQGWERNKTWKSQRTALWRQSGNIIKIKAAASAPAYPTSAALSGRAASWQERRSASYARGIFANRKLMRCPLPTDR